MRTGNFLQRQKDLLNRIRSGANPRADRNSTTIRRFEFYSAAMDLDDQNPFLRADAKIVENFRFSYNVFIPRHRINRHSVILLLHGLNERNWDKYLQWADYLALQTGKPVILFPIAYHMNRSPSSWANPRIMKTWLENRKRNLGVTKGLSFANVALSNRLSDEPYRFYYAGRQTMNDLVTLARQLRNGEHPLFGKDTVPDIFGYSIGSFLAEILLMANPEHLFDASRLFVFCGGAIFRQMYGTSRYIMDEDAYGKLLNYYCNEWFRVAGKEPLKNALPADDFQRAFNAMISPDIYQDERESFFRSRQTRISGISLLKDTVMPYRGVEACMGKQTAETCFEVMDFPFDYTHESPFPINNKINGQDLENAFQRVFRKCAAFLA